MPAFSCFFIVVAFVLWSHGIHIVDTRYAEMKTKRSSLFREEMGSAYELHTLGLIEDDDELMRLCEASGGRVYLHVSGHDWRCIPAAAGAL
jgi:hypothetical protein